MNVACLPITLPTTDARDLTPAERARHAKLQDAAEKFEGMMMQELLKPMQEGKDGSFGGYGGGFSSDDGEERDNSLDTISSFGTEAVAAAISKHGGLGIAKQVMRQIGIEDANKDGAKGK